ncbi:lysylphosphatidylglycerol synthase transmembrane domain-containing protein [Nocardiopsis alkaliphila]|uniref:lysylphosphatidylglycerol synthase transmembrane domain-containing protein n=1 Tax=Nocardiopsis alkaliphila TaxID=225762 RepID=UPI000380A3CA|nr:lysylphosphatidylglycerol synthase transmembrane domain-containing protein [Nocardiopsis alkaliphila]
MNEREAAGTSAPAPESEGASRGHLFGPRARWARPFLGLSVLVAVVWWYPLEAFTDAFGVVNASTVFAALGIGLATTLTSAARWLLVARGVGLRLPWVRAVGDYYRAVFLNAVLPVGVLGDVHRALSHGRYAGDVPRGVRAVVLERMVGQVVLAATGAALLFALPTALLGPGLLTIATSLGVVVLAMTVIGVGWMLGRRRGARWWRALSTTVQDARAGLCTMATGPGVLLSSVAALAGHVTLFLVAARAAGVTAPTPALLPLAVLALVAMSVPANIGGWGPREAVTALAFGAAGLGSVVGVTVSVVYGLLALVAALPGGVVLLWRLLGVQGRQVSGEGLGQVRQKVASLGGRGT